MSKGQYSPDDYTTPYFPIWCPGCGDFAVLYSMKRCLATLEIDPKDVLLFTGIGCSSRLPGFIKAYGVNGIHGRALPAAMGAKVANPDLFVIAAGGDGDGLSIGAGHFVHACRRNVDIVYILMQNMIYGLTKGQPSPTTEIGHVTSVSPFGSTEYPINSIALALTSGATFVARAFAGDPDRLTEITMEAFNHKGFAYLEVISPCVTYYDTYFLRDYISEISSDHDPQDLMKAYNLALVTNKQPCGIFYQIQKPSLLDLLKENNKKAKEMTIDQICEIFTRK
ncbi:MAG: 2-oxoacid:ferredoxin oxidoreductase subunit beta [Candidatus Heimdallarchaeota archaeon]